MKKAILLIILFSVIFSFSYSQNRNIRLRILQPKGDREIPIGDWFSTSFETFIVVDYPAITDSTDAKVLQASVSAIPVFNTAQSFTAEASIHGSKNAIFQVKKGEAGKFRINVKLTNLKKPGQYQCLIETKVGNQKSTTLLTIDRKNSPKKAKSFELDKSEPIYTCTNTATIKVMVKDTMDVETKFNPAKVSNLTHHFGDKKAAVNTAKITGEDLKNPFLIKPNDAKEIKIDISDLPKAGKYTGEVQINAEDEFSDTFEFTIYRRLDWYWVLGLILLGIGLNYLILWLRGTLKSFNEKRLEIVALKDKLTSIKQTNSLAEEEVVKSVFGHLETKIEGLYNTNKRSLRSPDVNKDFKEIHDVIAVKIQHLPAWLNHYEISQEYIQQAVSFANKLKTTIDEHKDFFLKELTTKAAADEAVKKLPVFDTVYLEIEQNEAQRAKLEKKVLELEKELAENQEEWKKYDDIFTIIQKGNLTDLFQTINNKEIPDIREKIKNSQWDTATKAILQQEIRIKTYLVSIINEHLDELIGWATEINTRYQKIEETHDDTQNGKELSLVSQKNLFSLIRSSDFVDGNKQIAETKQFITVFKTNSTAQALVEETIDRNFIDLINFFNRIPEKYESHLKVFDQELEKAENELQIKTQRIFPDPTHESAPAESPINRTKTRGLSGLSNKTFKATQDKLSREEPEAPVKINAKKVPFEKIPSSGAIYNQLFWQRFGAGVLVGLVSCIVGVYVLWGDKVMWGSFNDMLTAFLWGLGVQAAGTQTTSAATFNQQFTNLKPSA